jgi:hypothetical protein
MNDELAAIGGHAPQPNTTATKLAERNGEAPPASTPPEGFEPAPARSGAVAVTGPLRYAVQFSAQEEYVQLVERAKALLSLAHGRSSLEEIHLRAMRLLVEDLEKRRFAKTARPRRSRYISAAVRREVFERDAARCTFVDSSGQRCRRLPDAVALFGHVHVHVHVHGRERAVRMLTARPESHPTT